MAQAEARTIRLALIQMRCDASPDVNLARASAKVEAAARRGAQVAVLPELFLGPYFCQKPDNQAAFDLAEPVPGPTTESLGRLAGRLGIVLVGGSVFEKAPDGRYFNTAAVFGPDGSTLGTYRKSHIPEDILYHEQKYFAPGDTGVRVIDTPFGKIAPLICYDQWFPEAARLATLGGAELLVYPTAIGDIDEDVEENITGDWRQMWTNAMLGHAAANNVFVAAVNRVGREDSITFWGGSFVAGPSSEIMTQAGTGEVTVHVTCDLGRVRPLQKAWGFLANRRADLAATLAAIPPM